MSLKGRLAELEKTLGHRFERPELLRSAVTHTSFANENPDHGGTHNERLEFLGDAVLDLVISHQLVERFPEHSEGALSRLRATVVSEPGLVEIARRLGIGECLRLGKGEELTGGREKASILANACEAVVAAVYLDGGFAAAMAVVASQFGAKLDALESGGAPIDFKTRLQELVQAERRDIPRYQLVGTTGPDHDQTFEVELLIGGEVVSRGKGRNKKEAEQRAAQAAYGAFQDSSEEGLKPG